MTILYASVLAVALWSPPPDDTLWINSEAQLGIPEAPFVFSGDVLYTNGTFQSDRPFVIDQQAQLFTAEGTSLHLAGAITNTAGSNQGLSKYGPGTLVLSGNNAYRGNTILHEGTLEVSGSSALGIANRTLDIFQGTTLRYAPDTTLYHSVALHRPTDPLAAPASDDIRWIVNEGAATQAGYVNGNLPVTKLGAGTLYLHGFGMNTALTTVAEGALATSSFMAGPVQVNAGARLGGTGAINRITVLPGGTLAPGMAPGEIGTLSISGNLELQADAVLEADVNAQGQGDLVQVVGIAKLGGQVRAQAVAGNWQPSTDYTLLRAEGGLAGTRFSSAHSNLPFLTPSLSYDDRHVYLRLDRNETPLEEVAETPTEEEVAETIDSGGNPDLHDKIVVMDAGQAKESFQQLSGSWQGSVLSSIAEDSRFVRQAALLNVPRRTPAQGPPAPRFWSHVFHSSADRGQYDGTPADERNLEGLALGLAKPINPSTYVSAFLGSQHSRLWRRATANARVRSLHAGASLGGSWKGAMWALGAIHSWHRIHSHRHIAIAGLRDALSGNYGGRTLQAFAEVVAPVRWLHAALKSVKPLPEPRQDAFAMAPFARLAVVRNRLDGHIEQGGSAALNVSPASITTLFSIVGLQARHRLETTMGSAEIHAELAWHHAGGDTTAMTRQAFSQGAGQRHFVSYGQPIARHAWSMQMGLDAPLGKHKRLRLDYAGQYGKGRQDHGARLNVAWRF